MCTRGAESDAGRSIFPTLATRSPNGMQHPAVPIQAAARLSAGGPRATLRPKLKFARRGSNGAAAMSEMGLGRVRTPEQGLHEVSVRGGDYSRSFRQAKRDEGYALIAAISGRMPTMFITRVRL